MDMMEVYELDMAYRRKRLRQSTGYRTEDLVLHLDGIQNTRAGTHNPIATVWEDLAGNMDVSLYNMTWGENYAGFKGLTTSYGRGGRWTFTTGITIEVVLERTGNLDVYGSSLAGWPVNETAYTTRPVIVAGQAGISVRYDSSLGFLTAGVLPAINAKYHVGCAGGVILQNGNTYAQGRYLNPIGQTKYDFILANYLQSDGVTLPAGLSFLGRIYAVRVYDANLTAEELYAHWLIDKARFNIPEA